MTKNEDNAPTCDFLHVHENKLSEISGIMPDDDSLIELAELYKLFGDSTRIKILYALFEAELCVCDIATLIGASMSAVSHQLRILKQASLVKYRRNGKTVFYSLADDHVRSILDQGMEHINE
ncbi:MAG: winged helix-turn-helix transcriptional regulator [Ruminiclostridium sp.]|nr:winged helix-turn-helix transcriptional regulator [Ruminiclostridium sp.]